MNGLGLTSDSQLLELAKKMGLPKINYIGFAENIRRLYNGLSIINLGDDSIGGTHWTLLWVDNDNIVYFDSYGVPPEDPIIQHSDKRNIFYNEKQVQGYSEEYCGVWVLMAAKAIYDGYKKNNDPVSGLVKFIDKFSAV